MPTTILPLLEKFGAPVKSVAIPTDFTGAPNFSKSGNIVVGNAHIVKNLLAKVCDAPNLPGILR